MKKYYKIGCIYYCISNNITIRVINDDEDNQFEIGYFPYYFGIENLTEIEESDFLEAYDSALDKIKIQVRNKIFFVSKPINEN